MDCQHIVQEFQRIARQQGWSDLHTPKNLALALVAEVGELAAELQWLSDPELAQPTAALRARLGHEAADVLMYLLALCDSLGLDLAQQVAAKQQLNRQRFARCEQPSPVPDSDVDPDAGAAPSGQP
jgi:NTP pyrophosphatase (non-canonical NTP hydrolase)